MLIFLVLMATVQPYTVTLKTCAAHTFVMLSMQVNNTKVNQSPRAQSTAGDVCVCFFFLSFLFFLVCFLCNSPSQGLTFICFCLQHNEICLPAKWEITDAAHVLLRKQGMEHFADIFRKCFDRLIRYHKR